MSDSRLPGGAPPMAVRNLFTGRTSAEATPLAGGEERSFLVGEFVLKPVEDEVEAAWVAELLEGIVGEDFRVAKPVRSPDGRWVVDGWSAWQRLEGEHVAGKWPEIIAVGEKFHAALRGVEKPAFIEQRTNPWSLGDRVAWGDLPPERFTRAKHLKRLVDLLRPLELTSQLIHGDLTGNVLFSDTPPPAIIDFAPYWRPPGFASAIVVADALVWEGANESLLDAVAEVEAFEQLLPRALIYRIVADRHLWSGAPPRPDDQDPYLPVVELAARLARASA